MRFLTTLILLACVSMAMAQGTKIDDKEKARLENQFKALKTFYINDDGLVVYNIQKDESGSDNSSAKVSMETVEGPSWENKTVEDVPVEEPKITSEPKQKEYTPTITAPNFPHLINKAPIDPNTIQTKVEPIEEVLPEIKEETPKIKKETIRIVRKNNKKTEVSPIEPEVMEPTPQPRKTHSKAVTTPSKKEKEILLKKEEDTQDQEKKYISRKARIQKSPLKYKDMEEAAMAVDNLLEKLKREQEENQNAPRANSMSSRIAQGAGKSTLRKQTILESDIYENGYPVDNIYQSNVPQGKERLPESMYDDLEDGLYDPTYYINGELSNKAEVDNLKKKDIISREFRTRNTVSGNPAGEVWIETRPSK